MASFGEVLRDNFLLLFTIIIVSIVIFFLLRVLMIYLNNQGYKMRSQYEMDMVKLEIARKKAFMEELRNSTFVLNDSERKRLEAIRMDNSVLNRKLIADMNEIEERLKRIEVGSDSVRTSQMLGVIKMHEGKLFRNDKK